MIGQTRLFGQRLPLDHSLTPASYVGLDWPALAALITTDGNKKKPQVKFSLGFLRSCGPSWDRTSDLSGVNGTLFH